MIRTPERIQTAVSKYATGHSPKSVRNAVDLLSAACAMFFPDLRISPTLPQKKKTKVTIPTDAEVKALLKAAIGQEMYTVILLAAYLGLRRSEICPLTWADVDLENITLSLNKAIFQ